MTVVKKPLCLPVCENSASRYPSRNLRVCGLFDKVANCTFPRPLETTGNVTSNVALWPASKALADSRCRAADLGIMTRSIFISNLTAQHSDLVRWLSEA